jgi:hypothetical protein
VQDALGPGAPAVCWTRHTPERVWELIHEPSADRGVRVASR